MELSSNQDGEIQIPTNNYVAVTTNGHGHHHHMIHHHPPPPPSLLHHHNNNIITSSSAAAVPVPVAVVPQSQNPSINGTTTTTTNSTGVELDLDQSSYKKPLSQVVVKYRECLKNHAAAMGGNATDGCGEFMPSGEQGSIEALNCSACHCHRNFHRKEIEGETDEENYQHHNHNSPFSFNFNRQQQQQQHHSMRKFMLPLPDQPLGLGYHHHTASAATGNHNNNNNIILPSRAVTAPPHGHIIMPFNYNIPSESDEQEDHGRQQVVMKKRFRTKFTQEQKEKMLNFAEKVGWRFQKQDESLVQQFCAEIGVKRRVLKVWMHNNKHNLAKKQHIDITTDHLPTP
ncbi:zinc-finger homeodomain protein 2 [Vicia villosa]|uniref:zinc-finger homeodomain protein 2 n=1 Tax=Vicia villosa TaxID=3911 RepID=UPI00273C5EF9|nr:zinc-finger homeodomain protein 2 [Vicia villosa]